MTSTLRVAAAQDAPVFLDPSASTRRVIHYIEEAGAKGVQLLAFGETFLPGYPFWLEHTGGAKFEDPLQQEAHARYVEAAVAVDGPQIAAVVKAAHDHGVFVVLGIAERDLNAGAGSVYATVLCIDPQRGVVGQHRKLVPTHEERLVWAAGDGHGLEVHDHAGTRISALNCWENWMPLPRTTLYAQGTQVHVAIWPGTTRNTRDITRFIAMEGRVFVLSAGALFSAEDVPEDFPLRDALSGVEVGRDGGSAIAGPDGNFIVEPVSGTRGLVVADLDLRAVLRARQSFDPTGHYSRPDVFELSVDTARRTTLKR